MRAFRVLGLILALIILACGALYVIQLEKTDNERMLALYTEAEPLERQREELVAQRNSLPAEYALKYRDYATAELLFPKMDTQIYSEAYPLMREKNIIGVLGLSSTEYPAGYNKLTREECKALLGDGWELCMVYDDPWVSLNYFFQIIQAHCKTNELPFPTSLYFINNDYTPDMDETLKAQGVKTVILNSSDNSGTVTDISADLWFTGAMPLGFTGSDVNMELLGRTDGANLALTVVFNETWKDPKTKKSRETKEETSFKLSLENLKSMMFYENPLDEMEQVTSATALFADQQDQDKLYELYLKSLSPEQQLLLPRFRMTIFEKAHQYHLQAIADNHAQQAELNARTAELDTQIAELDRQRAEIYASWNTGKRLPERGYEPA